MAVPTADKGKGRCSEETGKYSVQGMRACSGDDAETKDEMVSVLHVSERGLESEKNRQTDRQAASKIVKRRMRRWQKKNWMSR